MKYMLGISAGDWVEIINSRTDEDSFRIFKGKVIGFKQPLRHDYIVAEILTLAGYITYELTQDIKKINAEDVALYLL
jgi:hypothetical protein